MNTNTHRQFVTFVGDHPELSGTEVSVLHWLWHHHDHAEDVSRPGVARLVVDSHLAKSTVLSALDSLASRGVITLSKRHPRPARKADEWTIPGLANGRNGAVDNEVPVVGNQTTRRTTRRTTSSPLRGERRSAPRKNGAPAAAPGPGDATDPSWCQMCEEVVPNGTPCPCEECRELLGCRVNPATARYYGLRVVSE